jgi:hypothetical protein
VIGLPRRVFPRAAMVERAQKQGLGRQIVERVREELPEYLSLPGARGRLRRGMHAGTGGS